MRDYYSRCQNGITHSSYCYHPFYTLSNSAKSQKRIMNAWREQQQQSYHNQRSFSCINSGRLPTVLNAHSSLPSQYKPKTAYEWQWEYFDQPMQLKKLNMCFIEWMAILFIVFSVSLSLSLFFLNTNNGRNNSFSSQIHRLFWESVAWFLFRVTTFYAHSSSIRSFVRSYMHPFLFVLLQFSIVCVTDIAFSCEDFFAVLVFGSSISNHICWHCGNFSFLFVRLSIQPNRTEQHYFICSLFFAFWLLPFISSFWTAW